MSSLSFNPVIQLKTPPPSRSKINSRFIPISARLHNNQQQQQQQLNFSVLRFTFGIPGLDESYLPRWIGYGFGSLLLLNHFFGSGSTSVPQLRSEALGLSLAGFSVALPYLGKFLKGATPVNQISIPEEVEQIFVMSPDISDELKEDLAWVTYILLRNTNTFSVMVSVQGKLCIRGYWNTPSDVSKAQLHDWFNRQIENIGLFDLKETLYFPQNSGSRLSNILPKRTSSLLVQTVVGAPSSLNSNEEQKTEGFVLVASSMGYAYSDKDRAWIGAIANKFRRERTCMI